MIKKIEDQLLNRRIVKVNSDDYSIKLTLDDGTHFTIYAQEWLGSPSLGYKSMKISKRLVTEDAPYSA